MPAKAKTPTINDAPIILPKIHKNYIRQNRQLVMDNKIPQKNKFIEEKNDIKHNVKPASLEELTKLQWDIVKASWDYVKKGGIMIYSTCTVNKAENEDMVRKICEEFSFERVDITNLLPKALLTDRIKAEAISRMTGDFQKITRSKTRG